jgi:hypothetical protein
MTGCIERSKEPGAFVDDRQRAQAGSPHPGVVTEAAEGGWGIAGTAFGRQEFAALLKPKP